MKRYPSIELVRSGHPPDVYLHTFDKIDGSNLRFEWTRKNGWWKVGRRTALLDDSNAILAEEGRPTFDASMSESLERWGRDSRLQKMVAFCEFAGARSFAGIHHPEDEKRVYLLDITIDNGGFLAPPDYLKLVEKTGVMAPRYFGFLKWNESFLRQVGSGQLEGVTFEGVVGKIKERTRHQMWKTKTEAWREAIRNKFDHAVAIKLLES